MAAAKLLGVLRSQNINFMWGPIKRCDPVSPFIKWVLTPNGMRIILATPIWGKKTITAVACQLSVCPSVRHVRTLYENGYKLILKLFSPSNSSNPTILVFTYEILCRNSDMTPFNRGVECKWDMKKIAIFNRYLAFSQKRYKIGPQLLWNANKKSCAIYWMTPFSMTSNDAEPRFQRHDSYQRHGRTCHYVLTVLSWTDVIRTNHID